MRLKTAKLYSYHTTPALTSQANNTFTISEAPLPAAMWRGVSPLTSLLLISELAYKRVNVINILPIPHNTNSPPINRQPDTAKLDIHISPKGPTGMASTLVKHTCKTLSYLTG